MSDQSDKPATATPKAKPAAKPDPVDGSAIADVNPFRRAEAIVDRWFTESFHGSPLGQSTELYNLVHAAVQDLKKRLAEA